MHPSRPDPGKPRNSAPRSTDKPENATSPLRRIGYLMDSVVRYASDAVFVL